MDAEQKKKRKKKGPTIDVGEVARLLKTGEHATDIVDTLAAQGHDRFDASLVVMKIERELEDDRGQIDAAHDLLTAQAKATKSRIIGVVLGVIALLAVLYRLLSS